MSDQVTRTSATLPPPPATFHFVGIGGIGMSGLARILTMWGYKVTGSDAVESAQTESLRAMGVPVVLGHDDPTYAGLADVVVTNKRAAANAKTELDAADASGARVLKRGDLLGMVANARLSVCVAGSHGKSTTSGMLATALRNLDADPTFAVGAIVAATGTNAEPGEGPHMVVEADEFDRSFHGLFPNVAIITSVAFDHPDIFDNQDDYDEAFVEFVRNIKPDGYLIIAGDDNGCERVLSGVHGLERHDLTISTFGETEGVGWKLGRGDAGWVVTDPVGTAHAMPLAVPGRHNARNAIAALAALTALGIDVDAGIRALSAYQGIGRRFDAKGSVNGADVIDDYAHHPDEVTAVLSAARETYPGRRVVAVHQPHTFSRTHALMKEFADSLQLADVIVLMDIYGVGEENTHHISSAHLGSLIAKPVHLVSGPAEAATKALEVIRPGDIVMTIGAGTVTLVGPLMIDAGTTRDDPEGPVRSRPLNRMSRAPKKPAITIPAAPHLKVMPDAQMSLYTTMRIGGPADFLVRAPTPDDVVSMTQWAVEQGMPVNVIGGGSNLLVSDAGIRGLVIVARTPGERAESLLVFEDHDDHVVVTVGAQAPLSWVGRYAAEHGWMGMDWGVGLPGQIGGATVNNAGAHGTELKDHLIAVELLYANGEIGHEDASWMEPAYRITRIKDASRPRPWTLLRSVFKLPKGDTNELVGLADEHAHFRKLTQPTGACSGSTFANPPGDFAGRLIEEAGLKGYQHGAMQLSPKHANWVMNTGGGTAVEAWELIQHVREVILDRNGVELRPEVERMGEPQF